MISLPEHERLFFRERLRMRIIEAFPYAEGACCAYRSRRKG
jgi:hypothetical protein